MIQTGVAEKAGAIFRGIRVGNPLMKAEGLLKERACEVTVRYEVMFVKRFFQSQDKISPS